MRRELPFGLDIIAHRFYMRHSGNLQPREPAWLCITLGKKWTSWPRPCSIFKTNSMEIDTLYRQELLEHYRNPQNFVKLKKATYCAYRVNPLCGDEMDLEVLLDRNGKIEDIAFSGQGCAISIASASHFTEYLRGKSLARVKRVDRETPLRLLGASVGAPRRKCALLVYDALQDLVKLHDKKTGTGKNRRNPRS